jgi:uncharacterized membrane protein YwaF
MSFFAPINQYPPCGMYTTGHLILFTICLIGIIVAIYFSRNLKRKKIKLITKAIAILVTILEIGKMGFNFHYGYTSFDNWLPLAFCSLFIYSCWMAGFGTGTLEQCGSAFLGGAGIICGLAFLLSPSTSLTMYPMLHYLCCYSMLFHSLMLYLGLLYVMKRIFIPSVINYRYYLSFCLGFCLLAIIINSISGCNMMFLREPFNIPLSFLGELQNSSQTLYTMLILCVYLTVPFFLVMFGYQLMQAIKTRRENKHASV